MRAFYFLMPLLATLISQEALADRVFAVVPKSMNNPFFDQARDGCKKAAATMPGTDCLYIGPATHSEEEQIQIMQDLITRHVAGIAVAPTNSPAIAKVVKLAKAAAIPVITFDSDLLENDRGLRSTYIGTKNYDIGLNLAKQLVELKPNGGTYALQSGGAAAANLNERMQGVRDTLQGKGWTEVAGTPVFCNDDSTLAIQQMADILTRYPKLDAFIPVGGWPQLAPQAYRSLAEKHISRIKSRELALVVADTLPAQMEILRDGLSHAQVGQRPFDMGYKAIVALNDLSNGKKVQDPIFTGLDICTQATAGTCIPH